MITSIENSLPPSSRLWIYQSSRRFSAGESDIIRQKIKQFISQWTSHKASVVGDGDLLYDLFIVLMVDESEVGVGGCSIDSSAHFIKGLGHEYKTNFFDRWNIAYKNAEGEVVTCQKEEFERLVDIGTISDDTIIFNNLLHFKKDFDSKWQIPYSESWLKNLRAAHTSFKSIL